MNCLPKDKLPVIVLITLLEPSETENEALVPAHPSSPATDNLTWELGVAATEDQRALSGVLPHPISIVMPGKIFSLKQGEAKTE